MPQFTVDPNNPGAVVANVATGGDVFGQKKKKKKKPAAPAASGGGGGGASTGGGKTAAQRRREAAERRRAAQAAREEARANRFNPLTAPFKSPAELRAEAIRLAELGSPTEATLREEQAREEAGLTGLTGALTTALGGVRTAQEAGLQGLGSLYQSIAGGAQQAGQSAAAAAGVSPASVAAGATPVAVQAFPILGAAIRGYESVAPVVGAQLVGGSRAGLSKALADRASRISSDTAKYLQQLQGIEYEKAVAQETARQNAARLGLSEQELGLKAQDVAFGQQIDLAKLTLAQQKLAAQIAKDNRAFGKDKRKKIQSTQEKILGKADTWTTGKTGERQYRISFLDDLGAPKTINSFGRSPQEAVDRVKNSIPQARYSAGEYDATPGKEVEGPLGDTAVIAKVLPILVNAGMSRANARRWIIANLLGGSVNTTGAFMGGVT